MTNIDQVVLNITHEEAIYLLGSINGDLSPWAKTIRKKLLDFLVQDPSVFEEV